MKAEKYIGMRWKISGGLEEREEPERRTAGEGMEAERARTKNLPAPPELDYYRDEKKEGR